MEQKKFYKKIKNYSIYNNVILFSLFVLVLVSVVTTVVEVKIGINKNNKFYIESLVVMFILCFLEIIVGDISIKLRRKYVKLFNETELLYLLNNIRNEQGKIPKYQFVELKYIFIKGLLYWINKNEYTYCDDMQRQEMIKNKIITKKQFLLISIFKCVSIKGSDINELIYINEFSKIVEKYTDILKDGRNNGNEYISKCFEIEEQFKALKKEAEETQTYSYKKKRTFVEDWVEFCSNLRTVKITKFIILIVAILIQIFQNVLDKALVSNTFNFITIILLAIELGDDKTITKL